MYVLLPFFAVRAVPCRSTININSPCRAVQDLHFAVYFQP